MQTRIFQMIVAPLLCAVALAAQDTPRDTGYAAMQQRGKVAMGVDQYVSTHRFDDLADGGRIELQSDRPDSVAVAAIRDHLQGIARAFRAGDFTTPAFVHMQEVPGTKVLAERREAVRYEFTPLPRGGAVRIVTRDSLALQAIHQFLAFQRREHHAGGHAR